MYSKCPFVKLSCISLPASSTSASWNTLNFTDVLPSFISHEYRRIRHANAPNLPNPLPFARLRAKHLKAFKGRMFSYTFLPNGHVLDNLKRNGSQAGFNLIILPCEILWGLRRCLVVCSDLVAAKSVKNALIKHLIKTMV